MTKFSRFGRGVCYILIIFFILPLLLSATAPQASAWISSDWTRRRPITITAGGNGMPENYQIRITVPYDANMQADYDDLRFYLTDDSTELPYWVENYTGATEGIDNAYVWVRLPFSLGADASQNIYMYYGNASAGSAENGEATFDFLDDFSTDSSSNYSVVEGSFTWDTGSGILKSDGGGCVLLVTGLTFSNIVIEVDSKIVVASVTEFGLTGRAQAYEFNNQYVHCCRGADYNDELLKKRFTDWAELDSGGGTIAFTPEVGTWYHMELRMYGTSLKAWRDGSERITGTDDDWSSGYIGLMAWGGGPAQSAFDNFRVRKFVLPEPTASVGAEETSGFPAVSNIACDNILLDRDVDYATLGVVTGTKLRVDVEFETGKLVVKENVCFVIYDKLNAVIDNKQATENLKLADNKQRFFVAYSALDNALGDSQLGGWDIKVEVYDNVGTYGTSSSANVFYVDDLDATRNVENLIKHRIRAYGTVSRVSGTVLGGLESVTIIDNEMGTFYGELSGNNWENVRAPDNVGQFYLKLKATSLDGLTDNTSYAFPNFAPEIVSISVDNSLIDRDIDYAGSGADTDTVITVRLRDEDSRSDFADAWIAVRDALDAAIDNENVFSTATIVDENQIDVTMTYDATDNTLANNQLGAWDAWAYVTDKYGGAASEWQTSKFTVDDLQSTINFDPAVPFLGWDLTVSGDHSRVVGAVTIDASWLIDNKHGQFALGASNSYNETYTISNATLDENISVTLRTHDGVLDGVTTSSYKINANVKFQVEVRFEENYEMVQWIPDENRVVEMLFEWDGGTHPYTLTTNPENIIVPAAGIATKIVKITDNDAYWRYVIPEFPGGALTFVLVDDPETVDQYRFFLQDYTGLYVPPNGQLLIKSWIGTNLAEINEDFWGADWRTTAWLVTGTQYQMWVRAPSAALRLVGPIDAVASSEEKTIIVQAVISELDPIFNHVYWAAWRESGAIIRMEYHDNLDNTIEAWVGIYDMDGDLMSQYQPDNEWFIVTWPDAENTESYEVVLTVQHGIYDDFTMSMPIGLMGRPLGVDGGVSEQFGLPAGLILSGIGSLILIFVVGLSFDALRVQLGMLAIALTTIFCWYMGFLPLPGPYDGAFTAMLILVAAVLFALTWRRGK